MGWKGVTIMDLSRTMVYPHYMTKRATVIPQ